MNNKLITEFYIGKANYVMTDYAGRPWTIVVDYKNNSFLIKNQDSLSSGVRKVIVKNIENMLRRKAQLNLVEKLLQ